MPKGSPLRFMFPVQGEGRCHLTHALALKGVIEEGGHKVVASFVGENPRPPVLSTLRKLAGDSVFWSNGPAAHNLVTGYRPHLFVSFIDPVGSLHRFGEGYCWDDPAPRKEPSRPWMVR
jgi:hypothetical protein